MVSIAFAPLAQVVCEGIGYGSVPLVVVPHPVGDRDEVLVKRRGEEIAAECVRVLTTPAGELARIYASKRYPLPNVMPR